MERNIFYDEIYEDKIRSIQKFEDDDISEWYACLYDYFLDHEDIISQCSTSDFSNERCFDKSTLDRVAKRLFQKIAVHYFLFSRKGSAVTFLILFHCCLPENNLSFRQVCKLTQLVRWSRSHTTDTDLENDWQPNHFVLLIPERLIRVKPNETQPIRRKCDITNFFAKIP